MSHAFLLRLFIIVLILWSLGPAVYSSEPTTSCPSSSGQRAILGLTETRDGQEQAGTPISFALYADHTVIYRDRKNRFGGFITGRIDDDEWQTFEKIVAGLPSVKTNFAFTEAHGQTNSTILFNYGKRMRELSMYGPLQVRKIGSGSDASYTCLVPPIQLQNQLYGSGEVPQAALGAWYEMHYFVPKDAHPWVPEHFSVSLSDGKGIKTVSWPSTWPQLDAAKPLEGMAGFSLQMPGKFLNEFERLFEKQYSETHISGRTFVVTHSILLPSEDELLASSPLGLSEEATTKLPPLPGDFLLKTKLVDIKRIAIERGYDMHRLDSAFPPQEGVGCVGIVDVIDELCQSKNIDAVDAGIELACDGRRNPKHMASMIASTHDSESVKALIIKHINDGKSLDIITPLIQESVARGADYDRVEPISLFWQNLRNQKNSLAWLPLHRMDIERSISFPSYSANGCASPLPSTTIQGKLDKNLSPGGSQKTSGNIAGKPFTAEPVEFNLEAAASCIRWWNRPSDGRCEAKLFETPIAISEADLSTKQLLKLRLDCLAGATASEVKFEPVSGERIFELLFGAASGGGAYRGANGGAYGRLHAWQSMSALTGIAAGGTFDDVYKAARDCRWWSIASKSKWFYNIAWDLGIVCLRPDRQHIAVLAASDED